MIAVFTVLAKVLGLGINFSLAHQFGAGRDLDVYVAAFRIPDFIFNLLISGTLSVAFIPVFMDYLNVDPKRAFRVTSTVFNFTFAAMAAVSFLGFLLAPFLVRFVVPGFSPAQQAETASLSRILMLSPLLFSLSSILTSILHSYKKFFMPAVAPLVYNLSILSGIFFLYPRFGLPGIAWGVVAGAALHFLTQLPAVLKLGLPLFSHFDLSDPGVRKIGKLFAPRILGIDLGQISLLIASVIGSTLASGTIAVYYYGFNLETVPLGVFALAFSITAFPVLSEFAAKKDYGGFKTFLSRTMVQLLFLIIPMSVLLLVLRAQIVRLILGALSGTNFTFEDTRRTALVLGFFAISLFAQALIPLVARAFYALQNTVIPVIGGAIAIVLNIIFAYLLTRNFGGETLALAFSLAAIFDVVFLFLFLRRKLGGDLADDFLFLRVIKISVASAVMGTCVYLSLYAIAPFVNMNTYLGILLQGAGAVLVGVLTYLFAGFVVDLPEARVSTVVLKAWFKKFLRV